MTRDELIAALEKATGPDRELDAAIALALGWTKHVRVWGYAWTRADGSDATWNGLPAYTASIDAAVSLVPDGWCPLIGQNVHHRHWSCLVQRVTDSGDIESRHDSAATPAIALCIAALKASAE